MDYELDEPLDSETRNWAMACHLAGLATLTVVPFASILAPTLLWLAKRDDHPFIDDQGKQAINFQISMWVYWILSVVVIFILRIIVIGKLLWWVPGVIAFLALAGAVWGGLKAKNGIVVRYPGAIKFI